MIGFAKREADSTSSASVEKPGAKTPPYLYSNNAGYVHMETQTLKTFVFVTASITIEWSTHIELQDQASYWDG